MPLSTPDMTWNDYGSNCRGDGMTDFFYCQPRELPCDPFNQDWQWTACSATASPPVRTAVSSSQTMQTANSGQYFDPSMISSGTSNLHSVGVKNTTPNFGLTPFSGNSISFFNPHPGHVPPVDHQSMLFRGQAECEEKTYKNKGYNQTSGTQAHAYHQPIIKKTKKTSRYVALFH